MISWIKRVCFTNYTGFLYLRTIFRPLRIVLSLLGLFPCSDSSLNSYHQFFIVRKSIYVNSICALAYVILILFFLILHIRHLYLEESSMTDGIVTQMNYITELSTLTIFCVVTYLCVFINRFKYAKILNVVASRVDPPNNNSEKVLNKLRFQINVVAMGFVVLSLLVQICINFTRSDSTWKMFLVFFTFDLPQMIQLTSITFFYILIMMLVGILKNIREQMLVIAKEKKIYMDGLMKVEPKQRTLTLRQMEVIYVEVTDVKQIVNHVFEAPILVTMVQCFHSIVSESHIIYHGVVVQRNLETQVIANCSVWIIYQLMKIYVIATAGNVFKLEVFNLGRAIHNIPTERQDLRFMMELPYTMSPNRTGKPASVRTEQIGAQTYTAQCHQFIPVQHFSSTILFHDNELTVFGYFPLDATLTFKIVASAAMYIIILVQFDKTK